MLLRLVSIWLSIFPLLIGGNDAALQDVEPNRGFIDRTPGEMAVGAKFDRFGGYFDSDGKSKNGTFVADYGADFAGRALPQSTIDGDAAAGKGPAEFRGYEVLKPIPTVEGDAIPWFGQPGGNKQYELPMSINDLKAQGYIREIGADVDAIRGDSGVNTTPDVDGGDGGSGGMKGADIYDLGSKSKSLAQSSDKTQAAIEGAFSSDGNQNLLPDSNISGITRVSGGEGKPSAFQMVYTVRVNGVDVPVSVNVEIHSGDNYGGVVAGNGAVPHGGDVGPATHVTSMDANGNWVTTIHLNGAHSRENINIMLGHEFAEIHSIVNSETPNFDPNSTTNDHAAINSRMGSHQDANVFKPGGDPNAPLSAHDTALVKEVSILANEISTLRDSKPKPNSPEGQRLASLEASMVRQMETLGITSTHDPRLQVLIAQGGMDGPTSQHFAYLVRKQLYGEQTTLPASPENGAPMDVSGFDPDHSQKGMNLTPEQVKALHGDNGEKLLAEAEKRHEDVM